MDALYMLPFDHRASFEKGLFGWRGPLGPAQTAEVAAAKHVVYAGFHAAVTGGVPKDRAAILVDEQFGAAILHDAARRGYITAAPAEKSGQDEFDVEYGEEFAAHIEAVDPTFCKVLVRYNPGGGRRDVGCIVLGRGADDEQVAEWLRIAAAVPGFIDFAVGRTTFWGALVAWRDKQMTNDAAAARIAATYQQWVELFENARAGSNWRGGERRAS